MRWESILASLVIVGAWSGIVDEANADSSVRVRVAAVSFQSARGWNTPPGPGDDYALDSVAKACLSCHDGTTARDAGAHMSRSTINSRGSLGASHPIGTRYAAAASRNPQEFRSPTNLRPTICLPEEKTSCISCHRLAGDRTGVNICAVPEPSGSADHCMASRELAASPRELCLSCHLK